MEESLSLKQPLQVPRFAERWLVAVPLMLLPVFIGGIRPWMWGSIEAFFLLGMVAALWLDRELDLLEGISKGWVALFGLLLAFPFLQAAPIPVGWLHALSPQRMGWLERAQEATGLQAGLTTISHIPLDTFFSGMWCLFLVLFALLFRKTVRESRDLGWLFKLLFVLACFEALIGLLQALIPGLVWPWEPPGFRGTARGMFINRNHYAAFMGMLWPLLLARTLAVSRSAAQAAPVSEYHERERRKQKRQKQFFLSFMVGLVVLGLFFSMSRGGILSAFLALTLFVTFGGMRRKGLIGFIVIAWAVMFAYGSVIGFDEIIKRFDIMQQDAPGRFKIWEDTWHLIKDHPWFGTGLETYRSTIFVYQSHLTDQYEIGHAHNDYLEIIAEYGIPVGMGLILMVWGYWIKNAWQVFKARKTRGKAAEKATERPMVAVENGGAVRVRRQRRRGKRIEALSDEGELVRVAALAGAAAFLFHGWVEFNWQIPASQVVFVMVLVLCGEGQKQRLFTPENAEERQRRSLQAEKGL